MPFQSAHRRPLTISALLFVVAASAHAVDKPTVTLPMLAPDYLAKATFTGRPAPTTKMVMSMSLAPSSRTAFEAYVQSVADRNSPNYRHYLTPAEIGTRFGASSSTVNTAVSYLKARGMKIRLVADNHLAILFEGTVAQTEAAFGTVIGNYHAPTLDGKAMFDYFSYQTTPKAPASFAGKVVSMGGLQNYVRPRALSTLTPSQSRTLYSTAPLYDSTGLNHKGEGINIAITNYDGYRLSNLPLFYSSFGLPAPTGGVGANVTKVSVDGSNGETVAASGEADLDIQMVLAQAPKAHLFIYDAVGNYDGVALLALQAQDNKADIITESYGNIAYEGNISTLQAYHDQHLALSAQGITYMCASGDYGTDLYIGNTVPFAYPDIEPEVLKVGGTAATVDSAGNRISEIGWNGSGSGWTPLSVSFNTLPSWQKGATVPTGVNYRLYPDIALHAAGANDGSQLEYEAYALVLNGSLTAISGTSAASPTFAGQLGLILQELTVTGGLEVDPGSGRPRLGAIQKDYIYPWDGRTDVFLDITTGDTGVLPDGSEALGKVGWDYITGYGVPNVLGMLNAFEEDFIPPFIDSASDVQILHSTSPNLTYGTNPQGGAASLDSMDGITYTVQSVKQTGVGQVAASTVDFNLLGDPAKRLGLSVSVAISTPKLTTGYVYLKNFLTSRPGKPVYDLIKTVTGSDVATSQTFQVNLAKYVSNSQVEVLVRGMKPSRLGSTPFRLTVDQVVVKERVKR